MNGRSITFTILIIVSGIPAIATSIKSAEAVRIGGIMQWISLRGESGSDPVLLFLHGGPGSSAMRYGDSFTSALQRKFVVVQWDQRAAGKTARLNASPQPLTAALFESDVLEMVNYLQKRFAKEKIYIMGHSWGGFLGLSLAAKHPEVVAAYVAISPMVFQNESERETLEILKTKSITDHNQTAIDELARVSIPFKTGTDLYYHRKWLNYLMGQQPYPQKFVESWAVQWLALFNEAAAVDFNVIVPEINCPIYFFLGRRDYQTYFELTRKYYENLKAPIKELYWFENSAHNVIITEPQKMQEIILSHVLQKEPK